MSTSNTSLIESPPIAVPSVVNIHDNAGGFMIAAGAVLGLCAGLLWTAQGSLMLAYPTEDQKGKFIGIFWSIFNLGGVVGASVSLGQNFHSEVFCLSILPTPCSRNSHLSDKPRCALLPLLSGPVTISHSSIASFQWHLCTQLYLLLADIAHRVVIDRLYDSYGNGFPHSPSHGRP